jgi:bacillithiol biosynthesis deacetylase BshB1
MSTPKLDVLVVATHPDDAEISVGGTILVCRERGLKVGVVDLTSGEPTPHGNPELRRKETEAATSVLQLDYRSNLGLPNRSLQANLDARREVAGVFRTLRPKVILAPYWEDVHPDHIAASQLVDAARFWSRLTKSDLPGEPFWPSTMYYYWSIHLRIHPQPAFVVDISKHIDAKMQAIGSFASQFRLGRTPEFPTALDDIRDRARYWGWSIGAAYGEPLASRESVGLPGLPPLLS